MSDGKITGDTPLRHAARGAGGGDGSPTHHRAVLPVDRSVLWTPIRDPGDPAGPAESGPYELFLARSVIGQIDRNSDEGREPRFGFLLGHVYRCPESGVHYSVADRVVPADEPMSEDAPDPFLLRAWADSQASFREHAGVLIGWYHTHYMLGLILSPADREMNERYFGEPWQCCVLTVPDPTRSLGAIFRPSAAPVDAEDVPATFRELLAMEDVPPAGPIATAVRWKNYVPDRDVQPVLTEPDEPEGRETSSLIRERPPSEGHASSVSLVLAENPPESMYPILPLRRKSIIWLLAAVAMTIGGYIGGLRLFESGGETTPVAPVPVEQPAPVPPEVQRFLDAATGLEEAMLRYEERRQDFDLGRIGCELLAGGYAAADDAFIEMAGSYAGLGPEADETRKAEYERLVEDTNQLNQHFDASGCPRPE